MMAARSKITSISITALLMMGCATNAETEQTAAPSGPTVPGRPLDLTIYNVTPETGVLWISVCSEAELPRRDYGECSGGARIDAQNGARVSFDDLSAGEYAASAWHDENANGRPDFDSRGIPTEAMGNTAGARGSFGPPTFDQMKFTLEAAEDDPTPLALTIRVERIQASGM